MSTWNTPITFTAASVLTAAQMNAEVRDHLNFLKGAVDLITNSTTADTSNATYLNVLRATATADAVRTSVTGDTQNRLIIRADGVLTWGSGSAVGDTTLYRQGVDQLVTDDSFTIGGGFLNMAGAGYLQLNETTPAAGGGVNTARIFCQDNGAGKTQIMAIFNTGAAVQVAIQP